MKKKLFSCVVVALFSSLSFAQSIPNAGFETWTNAGLYEDPDNWVTLNLFSVFGMPVTTNKTADAHSGSYAVLLETLVGGGGDTLPGFIMSGTGDFFSGINTEPFAFRPARMQFYYKGGPAANDTGFVGIGLTKWDSGTNQQIQVGGAGIEILAVANGYTLVDLTIDYATADIPDSITVFATSSNSTVNIPGSNLYLDDITFVMFGVGLDEALLNTSAVYPNPANETLSIRLNGVEANCIEIIDVTGRIIDEIPVSDFNSSISIKHLNEGNYLYHIKNKGVPVSVGKFVIVR